jgi:8-oxo-dGTP diphosphatase
VNAGAAAFIFGADGRLLVVKENYGTFRWSLPGGRLEQDEAPQDAVVREALEETGATVEIDHLIGIYRLDNGFQSYAFRCAIVDGDPAVQPTDELTAVEWIDPGSIPDPRSNLLHHALRDAVEGRRGVVRDTLPRIS